MRNCGEQRSGHGFLTERCLPQQAGSTDFDTGFRADWCGRWSEQTGSGRNTYRDRPVSGDWSATEMSPPWHGDLPCELKCPVCPRWTRATGGGGLPRGADRPIFGSLRTRRLLTGVTVREAMR